MFDAPHSRVPIIVSSDSEIDTAALVPDYGAWHFRQQFIQSEHFRSESGCERRRSNKEHADRRETTISGLRSDQRRLGKNGKCGE